MTQHIEKTTTTNQNNDWPRYRWLIIGTAALVLGLAAGWLIIKMLLGSYTYHGTVIQSPEPANNFTLTGKDGKPVSLSDFQGKVVLIYFGYTFCPDVCPATMVELANAVEHLGGEAAQTQVIMVSVDPARDTKEVLNEYVTHFNPSFVGLTGSEDEIAAAATPLGIFYEKHEGTAASGYLIDHTASVIAIDPDGYLRLIYPFNTPGSAIAEDVLHLMN
ncbi:MAG: SCO family protein [Candidatus Promineifilaceae bacterium]|nr:SCO family protein [Candidatus Promineifilaceae bacterium]